MDTTKSNCFPFICSPMLLFLTSATHVFN